jgi:hypothetical protein
MQVNPESFMAEQAKDTWWFILPAVITPIISVAILFQVASIDTYLALAVGGGTTLAGLIGGLIYRQYYLRRTASKAILLTIPEHQERSLSDLKSAVDNVTSLIREYEQKSIQEAQGYEIKTKRLAVLVFEAQSNQERLAAALDQMQKVIGERGEAVDLESA